ncbi:4'-phosphopantetheinyl transferase family protein [Desulforhopalus sp. 52FAK]
MIQQLSTNQIDVWLLPITGWSHEDVSFEVIDLLLTENELIRYERFRPTSKKSEFIASRILLRHILKRYTDCDTNQTEAIPDEMGRPFWFENSFPLNLFFSLSHTKEMICCAISKHREIGCDIESLQPRKYEKDLTGRVFSTREQQFYKNLPYQLRSEFFYRSWTLKEAFIKAVGQGLRVPLQSLSFTYAAEKDATFKVSPKDLGDNWTTTPYTFKSCIPAPNYSLGIATPLESPEITLITSQLDGELII